MLLRLSADPLAVCRSRRKRRDDGEVVPGRDVQPPKRMLIQRIFFLPHADSHPQLNTSRISRESDEGREYVNSDTSRSIQHNEKDYRWIRPLFLPYHPRIFPSDARKDEGEKYRRPYKVCFVARSLAVEGDARWCQPPPVRGARKRRPNAVSKLCPLQDGIIDKSLSRCMRFFRVPACVCCWYTCRLLALLTRPSLLVYVLPLDPHARRSSPAARRILCVPCKLIISSHIGAGSPG